MPLAPEELQIENAPFVYRNRDVMALEAEVQIGDSADKTWTSATLTFRTSQISGYDMKVSVQDSIVGKWSEPVEVGAISVEIVGDYERQVLIAFLQKVGLLTVPVFGRYESGPFECDEGEDDALRNQETPI